MKFNIVVFCLFFASCCCNSAVYTITQGSPNELNVYSVDNSGQLTLSSQVSTGGNGGGEGLGSESSLIVYKGYIFAVNAGSNTLSMFSISSTDATKVTLVGSPAAVNGEFPNSVTAYGSVVCTVSSGLTNGIRCFNFASTGLTAIANSDRSLGLSLTTPPAFHTGPAQISFTPDGSALAISIKAGAPSVMLYTISSSGVTETSPSVAGPEGMVPFGFAFDSTYMVLTDAAPFGGDGGVIPLSTAGGVITYDGNFTVIDQEASCWVIYNSDNGHFYTSNAASASITELSRSGTSFNIINSYSLGSNATEIGGVTDSTILNVGGQDYFFQVAAHALYVLKLGTNTATIVQTFPTSTGASGIAGYTTSASSTSAASERFVVSFVAVMLAVVAVFA